MPRIETEITGEADDGLPVVLNAQRVRPSLAHGSPEPDFLSQMIAARDRLATQRRNRRAPLDVALNAYREGLGRGIRRLPGGSYRNETV